MIKMLYSHSEIQDRIVNMASDINALVTTIPDFEDAVCVPVLQGSIPFFHDMTSYICWNPVVAYAGVSSYNGQKQSSITTYKFPKKELIKDKCVFLFDDILDTGTTVNYLTELLYGVGAKEVIPVVLLKRKLSKQPLDSRIKRVMVGFEIEDEWVFGYGMDDENGKGRALKHILHNEPDNQAEV